MTRISLLTPSRQRVGALRDMLLSAWSCASSHAELEACVYVDLDDPDVGAYMEMTDALPFAMHLTVGPPRAMSDLWNAALERATGEVLMLAADDLRFRSDGWDLDVLDEFERWPDRLVLVWGPDGNENGQKATHPFLHRRWVELFGRFTPPMFTADYCDLWLYEVAHGAGRDVFLPGLFVEHMHVSLGKSPDDETERRKVERQHQEPRPAEVWEATADERAADVALLLGAIAG